MFEGKPPRPGQARPLVTEPWQTDALRELSWADLVARLSASRGIRGGEQVGDQSVGIEASFDADCARRIAALHNGEQLINPDDSGNGKVPGATATQALNSARAGAFPGAVRK